MLRNAPATATSAVRMLSPTTRHAEFIPPELAAVEGAQDRLHLAAEMRFDPHAAPFQRPQQRFGERGAEQHVHAQFRHAPRQPFRRQRTKDEFLRATSFPRRRVTNSSRAAVSSTGEMRSCKTGMAISTLAVVRDSCQPQIAGRQIEISYEIRATAIVDPDRECVQRGKCNGDGSGPSQSASLPRVLRLMLQPILCRWIRSTRLSTLAGGGECAGTLDLGHVLLRQMRLQEGAHVELFPPAVQNQAAGLSARFLPAIAESHLVAEAAATRKNILVVLVQHGSMLPSFGLSAFIRFRRDKSAL